MAFRRAKIKEQFDAAIPAVLEPGEQVQAESMVISGPSPWLVGAVGWLVMLLLGQRYYFIAVTDRRVIFMKASMFTGRPKGLAWADPRGAAQVTDVDLDNAVWSKFRYHRPEGKEIRINVHRFWREDGQQVVATLQSQQPAAPAQVPPQPQVPQQGGTFQA